MPLKHQHNPESRKGGSDKPQADKFRDLARQLGCDEDEKAFEEKVKRVAGGSEQPKVPAQKPHEAD